jgi:hypothetical protein
MYVNPCIPAVIAPDPTDSMLRHYIYNQKPENNLTIHTPSEDFQARHNRPHLLLEEWIIQ